MEKTKILFNELKSRNNNIYYSSKDHNIKIIYIQDKKFATNNKYYVFEYNFNEDIKKHQLLLSDLQPSELKESGNNEFNNNLSEIIKQRHNHLNDDEILKIKNFLLNSLNNLIIKNKPQKTIINILNEEEQLFNNILEIFKIATEPISTNEFIFGDLYVSNGIKTDNNTIFLLYNSHDEEYKLLIQDNLNNTLNNRYKLSFKDINNLSETEKLLLTGIISQYNTNNNTEEIIYNLIDDLNNNIKNYIQDNIADELIINYMVDLQKKITHNKFFKEKQKKADLIQSLKQI